MFGTLKFSHVTIVLAATLVSFSNILAATSYPGSFGTIAGTLFAGVFLLITGIEATRFLSRPKCFRFVRT